MYLLGTSSVRRRGEIGCEVSSGKVVAAKPIRGRDACLWTVADLERPVKRDNDVDEDTYLRTLYPSYMCALLAPGSGLKSSAGI